MKRMLTLLGLAALLIAGCATVGPDYSRPLFPAAELGDVLADAGQESGNTSGPVKAEDLAQWWLAFNDPLLVNLIEAAFQDNLDIKQAQSRVRMSRLSLGIATSDLYPSLQGSGGYSRRRASENATPAVSGRPVQEAAGRLAYGIQATQTALALPTNPASALLGVPGLVASWPSSVSSDMESDFYRAGIDASWEIDIFGGNKRRVEAAKADLEAVQANLNHIWVSLASAVASRYIELRTHQTRLAVAESNLDAQQGTYDLLKSLYESGLCDELALQQVSYVLEGTRASIPALRGNVESSLNSLALLTGQMPGSLHTRLTTPQAIPKADLCIVTGIPADALRQRPDIRVAERNLAAQSARIGVATADLYPKLSLTGSIGLESLKSSSFLNSDSGVWSFGPSLSWPIFNAGAIRKNIAIQNELQQQYLFSWEQCIQNAVKEVRDALVDYAQEQERCYALDQAVKAATAALEVAQDQYRNGLSDFTNVLDAQRSLLAYEEQQAISKGTISLNLVRIYKALGGGWQPMAVAEGAGTPPMQEASL